MTFQASLNEVLLAEGTAMGPDSLNAISATAPIDSLYPDSSNALLIERGEGSGTLYYRVDLQTYQPAETAQPIQRGINLQREYYLAGEGCPAALGCSPIDSISLDSAAPSQFISVVLTVNLPHDMYNLMVEDFIPSGTEVLNRRLLTSQTVPEASVDYLLIPVIHLLGVGVGGFSARHRFTMTIYCGLPIISLLALMF
jgi:hypothetical protein